MSDTKTCKNCLQFQQCYMWNYSYDPCPEWEEKPLPPFEEDLSDGALD